MVSRRAFLAGTTAALANLAWIGRAEALEAGQPSRTARSTALQRAVHQILESPRVFDDPVALRMFGAKGVAWLGHNMDRYRTPRPAVIATLSEIASAFAPDTRIVFDFGVPAAFLEERERRARENDAAKLARIGEPWITYFDPAGLAAEMRALGYRETRIVGTQEANELYFKDRSDGFRVRGSGRIMLARV